MYAIRVNNLMKKYKLYEKPVDRLFESLNPFRKNYHKDFYALNDVTFDVKKGETVGIIGKNGSGKSTLLKIITGVLTPSSGTIQVNGKISALLELGAGFNPDFTGIENIYLNGTLFNYTDEEITEKLDSILSFAEIGDFVHRPVKTYSSGMFARLAFAVAINVEPDILIVDEALSVGDVRFQSKCFNRFKELKDKGVTILFVSHDVFAVRNFCDKAVWINDGEIKKIGNTVDVTAEYMEFMNCDDIPNQDFVASVDHPSLDEVDFNSDIEPINRWGSHVGLIKMVQLLDVFNKRTGAIEPGQRFKIKIIFYCPHDIEAENLSIAFSIKNTMGLDLIVSTTFDYDNNRIKKTGRLIETVFELDNVLNVGDYILVIALEDRRNNVPEYYDYIEGALYFKVFSKKQLFGLIHLPVHQEINYIEGESND